MQDKEVEVQIHEFSFKIPEVATIGQIIGNMYEKKHNKVNCISSGLTSYCKWYKYCVDSFFKGMSNW